MKKKIVSLLLAATALTTAFGLAACGEDEDGKTSEKSEKPVKYTVTYEIGTGATGSAPAGGEYSAGAKLDLAKAVGFSKADNTFNGWLCDADSITYDAEAQFTMPEKNVIFTAQWKPDGNDKPEPATFTVTYDLNGGEGSAAEANKQAGAKFDLAPSANIKKAGFAFNGWLCDADNITYDAGDEYTMPGKNVTFTAQWATCKVNSAEEWKAAFDFEGVDNATVIAHYYGGKEVETYKFDGDIWYSSYIEYTDGGEYNDESYVEHKPDEIFDAVADPTRGTSYLYDYDGDGQKWIVRKYALHRESSVDREVDIICRCTQVWNEQTQVNEYRLDDLFSLFEYNEQTARYELKGTTLGRFTDVKATVEFRNGKFYRAYINDLNGNEKNYFSVTEVGTTSVTIPDDALQTPLSYSVEYEYNGGMNVDDNSGNSYSFEISGKKFNLPTGEKIEKSGYVLSGWLCDADNITYDAGAEFTMLDKDVTFTAQWVLAQ